MLCPANIFALSGVRPVRKDRYTIEGVDDVRQTAPTRFACYSGGVHVGDISAPEMPVRFEDGVWGWSAKPAHLSIAGAE